ncbi:hypothetical protein [Roseateles oligotrophus]|uniref:DUF4064 domain-containing protein n=1 Tax=Roseateles oligotrophus TaxID=1769250 RepID=A0ABT2YB43_9BURK|nr:hypothetical protein [Roseateles oligotrophus]MCV2367521.1 hypothetical protein [Roseateles oligotrophus]
MKTAFKWLLILSLGTALLGLWAGGTLWHEFIAQPDVSISINGEDWDFEGLQSLPWFGGIFGMLAAGAVVCLVIPLVLLFSVGLPILLTLMVLGFVAVGLLSLGAMLFSPVIIIGLLLWLVLRNKRPRPPRRTSEPTQASIAG